MPSGRRSFPGEMCAWSKVQSLCLVPDLTGGDLSWPPGPHGCEARPAPRQQPVLTWVPAPESAPTQKGRRGRAAPAWSPGACTGSGRPRFCEGKAGPLAMLSSGALQVTPRLQKSDPAPPSTTQKEKSRLSAWKLATQLFLASPC